MSEIKIVVIDDHPLFRQGVVDLLSLEADFKVLAQAKDGEEGLNLVRALKPDVAVVDVNLPAINGHQVTRQIIAEKLPTYVVLLTAYDDMEQLIHAMRGGASAFCSKDVQPEKLVAIIRNVSQGMYIVGDNVFDHPSLEAWLGQQAETVSNYYGEPALQYLPLSSREMEVLNYVSKGMSNKEIAISLGISHQTVKNHVTSILRKLGVEDRTQAAIFAFRRGWVRLYKQDPPAEE